MASDARTLNFAQTFLKLNKRICVISIEDDNQIDYSFDVIKIKVSGDRVYSKMNSFFKEIKKLKNELTAEIIFAEDFFSLKSANYLAGKDSQVIYDSREIYSEIASLKDSFFRQSFQSFLEKKWIKKINKIIVTGKQDKEYLTDHFKKKKSFYIIPNYPHFKERIESNYLRERFNINQEFILIYQGMLSEGRGIERIVKAMKILPSSALCLVGDGDLKPKILDYIEKNNLQNQVFLTGLIDYNKLHEVTCSADLGLSLIQPISFSYQLALPNKLFEYEMANIPFIVSDLPQMQEIVSSHRTGIAIPYDSTVEETARAINSILHNKTDFLENSKKASKMHCWESNEDLIKQIIEK